MRSRIPAVQFVDVSTGERIAYRDWGSAPDKRTLLLVHGYGCDNLVFQPLIEHHRLANLRCVAMNVRAFGESSENRVANSLEDCAADVAGLIEALDLKKPTILGFSMGGAIALQTALQYPHLITSLITLNSIPFSGLRFPNKKGWATSPAEVEEAMTPILDVAGKPIQDFDAFFKDIVLDGTWPGSKDEFVKHYHNAFQALARQKNPAMVNINNATFNVTTRETNALGVRGTGSLAEIAVPFLVIHGKRDPVCPLELVLEDIQLYSGNNDKIRVSLHQGGHYPMLECLDELAILVEKNV